MKVYSDLSIYLSAYSKLPSDMPAAEVYHGIDISLIVNRETGEIEDAAFTLLTDETKAFLKQIIVGYNLKDKGVGPLVDSIKTRYYGSAQKAICVTLRSIYQSYCSITGLRYIP